MQLTLLNTEADRRRILPALEQFAREHQLPPAAFAAADLALEEHVTNVIEYAYDDTAPHEIQIRLSVEDGHLQIEIEDDGRPFNPLTRPPVDTSLPLDEKPVGGLGVHLIRSLMDEAEYRRESGKNILRLRKRI